MMKKLLTFTIIFLLVGMSVIPSTGDIISENYGQPGIVYVDDDFNESTPGWGYDHFDSIQDGVDAVNESGTVYVYSGNYTENFSPPYYEDVYIYKSLNLTGEDKETTILTCLGTDDNECAFLVGAGINNANISGFTLKSENQYGTGIYGHWDSNNIRIEDCIIHSFKYGIYVRYSCLNWTINNCTIYNNVLNGITFWEYGYDNIEITECNCYFNGYGVHIIDAVDSVISNCKIYNNSETGLYIYNSNSNVISSNNISSNDRKGVYLYNSNGNNITGNTIYSNEDGIHLGEGSNNNVILGNTVSLTSPGTAICIYGDTNLAYHNNLIDNVQNGGDDPGTNFWDNGAEGNYWDDYNGTDENGDGIGDTPYVLPHGYNQDNYPLMYPWYPTHPDTVYVDDDYNISTPGFGYDRFNRIQYGIKEVEGSTVYVYNGIYYENVVIDKTINLIGEDRNTTIIDGSGIGDVVYVSASRVNLSNFTIQNGIAGITINSDHNVISNNTIKSNSRGILFEPFSNKNYILSNNISKNVENIRIQSSSGNTIACNTINSNQGFRSIQLLGSNNNTIENNTIRSNTDGIWLRESNENIISSNFITGGSNYYGILLINSFINNIEENTISLSGYGLAHGYSSDNIITGNTFSSNIEYGIFLTASSNNNTIYHNNFINNTQNAYDECSNTWDNGYPSGGNYWSDYTGDDFYNGPNQDILGRDGIGDTPYNIIGGDNQDIYPCMEPNGWINSPPNVPEKPSGEVIVLPGVDYNYTTSAIDPDDDSVWFKWDWGDGTYTDWLGPYDSGEEVPASASWSQGTYEIRVKAKDSRNPETDWSEPLTVNVIYPNLKTVFLFGFVTNLSESTGYYSFNAVKLLWISFNPIFPEILASNEVIVISDKYFGFPPKWGTLFGFYNAMVLT